MLTVKEIKGLQPKKSPYYVWDKTGERGKGRLGVQVMPSGSINFKFRYFKGPNNTQFIPLGKFPGMTLSQARDLCKEYSDLLSQGIDPKTERKKQAEEKAKEEREQKELGTFEQLINFHTQHKKDKGNRSYQDEYQKIVANVFPYVDINKKAKDFEAEDFLDALAIPIDQGYDSKSNKIRSILHAAFNFALEYDNDPKYRNRGAKFGIKSNPISNIPTQSEKVGNHYLSWKEVIHLLYDMEHRYDDLNLAYQTRQVRRFSR